MPKILQALLCQNLLCQNKRKKSKESVNIEESEDCEEDQSSGSQTIKVNKDTERLDKTIENLDYEAGMDHDKDECHVYENDDQQIYLNLKCISKVDIVVVQCGGRRSSIYSVAAVMEVKEDEIYTAKFH